MTTDTTEWVSQSEAVRLLAARQDEISQPALSQYLKKHPEVARQDGGPGKAQLIDFASLMQSRATRRGRGPASMPTPVQDLPIETAAPELELTSPGSLGLPAARDPVRDQDPKEETFSPLLSKRKAIADTETAEFNARSARMRALEMEGRLIDKVLVQGVFQSAAAALLQAFDQNRRRSLDEIRAAVDSRAAEKALRAYEAAVRAAFASSLTDLALAADPVALAAQ